MKKNSRQLLTPDIGVVTKGGAALPFIPTFYPGDSGVVSKRLPVNNMLTEIKFTQGAPSDALTEREQAALVALRDAFGAGLFPRFGEVKVPLKNGKPAAHAFGLDAGILNAFIKKGLITPIDTGASAARAPGAQFQLTHVALTFTVNKNIRDWQESPANILKVYQPPKPAAPAAPVKKPIRPRAPAAAKKAPATV
jgi:hypothetical protein